MDQYIGLVTCDRTPTLLEPTFSRCHHGYMIERSVDESCIIIHQHQDLSTKAQCNIRNRNQLEGGSGYVLVQCSTGQCSAMQCSETDKTDYVQYAMPNMKCLSTTK